MENTPLADKVKCYFHDYTASECRALTYGKVPTWDIEPAKVDLSLTKEISKHENAVQPYTVAMYRITTCYADHLVMYTDTSKTVNGRISVAFCIPTSKVEYNT